MELCLGTVQFGLDYGVFETKRKDPEYCIKCLDYATQNGIFAIDTAVAYGTAEEIVGNFLKKRTINRDKLFISTKLLPNCLDGNVDYIKIILSNIESSLKALNTDYVDAYFLHSSRYAFNYEILNALQVVKKKGYAKQVGVSIYYPDEGKSCFESGLVDRIQLPYSIFDHRMKNEYLFENIPTNIKIDSRSAFLKGVIRLNVNDIPKYLYDVKPILEKLDYICKQTKYSRIDLAIGYIKREKCISRLVFGIRDINQLKEDICSFNKEIPNEIFTEIDDEFNNLNPNIIIPSLWKK